MKKLSEKTVYEGNWLYVKEIYFENKQGDQHTWETVLRKRSSVGVVVIARLMPSRKFILIKQYRPAIEGYILSFPAGLGFNDPNHALVELREETGYVGRIVNVSPVLKSGASLINDSARVVVVEVDEHLAENKNPKQELEASEDIEVVLVDESKCHEFMLAQEKQGVHLAANLWYLFGVPRVLRS